MKQELGLLKEIIAAYTPDDYNYEPQEGDRKAKKSDYNNVEVIPVSDPNASTMAQKIVQYQAVMQLAQQTPQIYNMPLLHRQMLEVLGIKNANMLIPMDEDQKPADPVTENQNILMMKPVKAFAYQDHQSHIAVHTAALQDPKILALVENNPMAPQIQAAMMAHINEHLGYAYRVEIEKQLGMELPPETDENGELTQLDPEVENRLAPMLAQAAQRLLQQNQAEAQQQKAQQMQQDPIIQMQQQELQLKAAEQKRKGAKDATDAQFKAQQLKLEQARLQLDAAKSEKQQSNDMIKTASQLKFNAEKENTKLMADAVKQVSRQQHEAKQHESGNKHNRDMKSQDVISRNLQAVMAARRNVPKKGE
jgi:hypothetical protein